MEQENGMFNGERGIWPVLSTFGSIIIANICMVVCCVPIVTAGASITACASVMDKTAMGEEPDRTIRAFIDAFKENFKQSTIAWLIMLVIGALLAGDLYFGLTYNISIASFFRIFGLIGIACWIGVASWLFPMIARYDNGVKAQLSNAVSLAITQLPRTLIMVVLKLLPIVLSMVSWTALIILVPLMLTVVFALIEFLCGKLRKKVYEKYS